MRLIDADRLIEDLEYDVEIDTRALDDMDCLGIVRENLQVDKDLKRSAIDLLEHAPTVDAVEVVRCENCKHYEFGNYGTYPYINGTCTYHDRGAYPKCYCNFGERKDDE